MCFWSCALSGFTRPCSIFAQPCCKMHLIDFNIDSNVVCFPLRYWRDAATAVHPSVCVSQLPEWVDTDKLHTTMYEHEHQIGDTEMAGEKKKYCSLRAVRMCKNERNTQMHSQMLRIWDMPNNRDMNAWIISLYIEAESPNHIDPKSSKTMPYWEVSASVKLNPHPAHLILSLTVWQKQSIAAETMGEMGISK